MLVSFWAKVVVLDFTYLAIEAFYDGLVIFDGPTTAAPLVAGFDGTWNPSLPTGIRSTGDSVLVWFFSDSTIRGRGFNVSYTSDVLR
jgi:CUB domain